MEQDVLVRILTERLNELERAQADAAHRLAQFNAQIAPAAHAVEAAQADEKTAQENTRRVAEELGELRGHINDLLTRGENYAVSAGSLQALVGTLRLTLEALQRKLRDAHERLRECRSRMHAEIIALDHARTAELEAHEDHARLTEEVDVLRAHIESLKASDAAPAVRSRVCR